MIQIRPFNALRPQPDAAGKIVSPPYDVVNRKEAEEIASDNMLSFIRVVRSEVDFPSEKDPYSPDIYKRAKENLTKLVHSGQMMYDGENSLYVYRLNMGQHQQTGLVALANVDDYIENRIKKHELTRRDKEDDRTNHVDTTGANTGPVFLMFKSAFDKSIAQTLNRIADTQTLLYDVTVDSGARHRIYKVPAGKDHSSLIEKMQKLDALYIADGHHRAASAVRVAERRREISKLQNQNDAPHNWFLSVSFPDEELQILPYNRVVHDLNGLSSEDFLEKIKEKFTIEEGKPASHELHQILLYMNKKWYTLTAKEGLWQESDVISVLDVTILQNHILSPILNIKDPRSDHRIHFVGGIKGDRELENLVDSGEWAVAFSMYPTTTGQLIQIADAGKIMPPKSTWFEPKLRSGFLVNTLDPIV